MKTRFLSVIALVIITMLTVVSCNVIKDKEYTATGAEYFNFTSLENGTYSLSLKEDAVLPAKVYLPTSYNGADVTVVEAEAFKGNETVTELIVPVGYELIEEDAFSYCKNLKKVKIATLGNGTSRNLTIAYSAFANCESLIDLKLGPLVKVIEGYAFYNTKLSSVELTKVESLGVCSFGLCTSLKSVFVPTTLVEIHERAFENSEKVVFNVADNNPVYKDEDGKLLNK